MKAYFFKYQDIAAVIQASFPESRTFRKKDYRIEANLEEHFGAGEFIELLPESIFFFLETFKMLMDVDLASSGYSDFDGVAYNIHKRNDGFYNVLFLTDRSRQLYQKRLLAINNSIDECNIEWFQPNQEFKLFARYILNLFNRVDSSKACVLVHPY